MNTEQMSEPTLSADSVAQAVDRTWHRLTGSAPEPGVSFEEAGGDSLGLMEIVFILERALNTKLPLDRFHGGLTAEEFAEEALNHASTDQAVAPRLQTPIFLCPPALGDMPHLAEFRRNIGNDVRFVTIEYPDWRGCAAAAFGLHSLVDAVRAAVTAEVPSGPVRLAGYSLGSLIAYEAALALETDGREVSFLGILDAPAPGAPGPDMAPISPPSAPLSVCWWAIRKILMASRERQITRRLGRLVAFACASGWAAPLLRRRARRPALSVARSSRADLSDWTSYYLTGLLRTAACERAVPYDRRTEPRLRAPLVLFRCAGWHADAEPDFGWGRVAENVTVMPVPGNHHSTLTPPHVVQTAATFVTALAGSQGPTDHPHAPISAPPAAIHPALEAGGIARFRANGDSLGMRLRKMIGRSRLRRAILALYRNRDPARIKIAGLRPLRFTLHKKTDLHISDPIRAGVIIDHHIVALMQAALVPGAVLADIGANLGWFSVIGSKLAGPAGRVLSFEPDPDNLGLLRKNLLLNKCENVDVFGSALGSSQRQGTLYRSVDNQGDHQMSVIADRSDSVPVEVDTLDNIVSRTDGRIDFVKMDTQGSEAAIFAGMRGTVARNPRMRMVLEFWPEGLQRCGSSVAELAAIIASFEKQVWVLNPDGTTEPTSAAALEVLGARFASAYGDHTELVLIPHDDWAMEAYLRSRSRAKKRSDACGQRRIRLSLPHRRPPA